MAAKPFSMRTFFADGTPDGLKIVARSNWAGRALVIPRPLLTAHQGLKELADPGIYVLVGPKPCASPAIEIGSADPLNLHLDQHAAHSDFWSWALVSTSKQAPFSPAQCAYLATRLTQEAQQAGRAALVNSEPAPLPNLAAEELAELELFLLHLLSICPPLGLDVFVPPAASLSDG